jgi:hypothetical protein
MEECKYDTICYGIVVQMAKKRTSLEKVRKANGENLLFLDKFSDPYSKFEALKLGQGQCIFLSIFRKSR